MKYLKYLWKTDLRKLSLGEKILSVFIYCLIPYICYCVLLFITARYLEDLRINLISGFLAGYGFKSVLTIIDYAFELD